MSKPSGLVLSTAEIQPDVVRAALDNQGGPAWDKTVFRLLSGVDVASLVAGEPRGGGGTAISLASSGWWLRPVDALAQSLADAVGAPVLSVFCCEASATSGYHLARPGGAPTRAVLAGEPQAWTRGVEELTGVSIAPDSSRPLDLVSLAVHGDDPKGADLPGMCHFGLSSDELEEWTALVSVRGAALVAGCPWRPGVDRDPQAPVPRRMKSLALQTAVRLPGPPRWARALRAVAIRTAEEVIRGDGWVCLVPQVEDSPASYGTAVRILQLAPLPDGSSLGVLHPRAAVRVESSDGAEAEVEVVASSADSDAGRLAAALDRVLSRLEGQPTQIEYDPAELRASDDPAFLLGWQLQISPEHCQRYLAATGAAERLEVIEASLGMELPPAS